MPVTVEVPRNHPTPHKLEPVTLNAVFVEEAVPPSDGGKPIRWLLLTSLPIESFEQVSQCVEWYSYRWLIERFHYTLKSGCGIEELQLESALRKRKALATYSIVAWRLMWLTYQARLTPDASCQVVLQPAEWRLLRRKFVPKSRSNKPPTLRQAMVWIAQLGGFLARKGDGEPGVKTLWRGLTKLHNLMEGAQLASKT
ncbi:IS4 family transposase [Egbenema bharatensis]|uniref:IS4 family transposase n=1 Tax=Egbenema bharatensis TaxID=3463334 RepID=UPI003A8AE496